MAAMADNRLVLAVLELDWKNLGVRCRNVEILYRDWNL